MSNALYYLGLTQWSHRGWQGSLLTNDAKPSEHLAQYSQVFNSVEGNTTFYGLPTVQNLQHWRDSVGPNFRFCFKFPRTISHDAQWGGRSTVLQDFFNRISPLSEQLGLLWLQLPNTFSPKYADALIRWLKQLPTDFHYGLEVRHPDWFLDAHESRLNEQLRALKINRVNFDTSILHSLHNTADPSIRTAQQKKPRVPVRHTITGSHPMLRFVGDNVLDTQKNHLRQWARYTVDWIRQGHTPYVFIHAPDTSYAPPLAVYFHEQVNALLAANGQHTAGTVALPLSPQATPQQIDLF